MNIDRLKTTGYLHDASDIFDPEVTEGTLRSFLQTVSEKGATAENKNAGRCGDCVLDKSASIGQVALKVKVSAKGASFSLEWKCSQNPEHIGKLPNVRIRP